MADAEPAGGHVVFQPFDQQRDLAVALRRGRESRVAIQHRDAGRVVTTVLEALQAVDQYRARLPFTQVPDNPAHRPSIRRRGAKPQSSSLWAVQPGCQWCLSALLGRWTQDPARFGLRRLENGTDHEPLSRGREREHGVLLACRAGQDVLLALRAAGVLCPLHESHSLAGAGRQGTRAVGRRHRSVYELAWADWSSEPGVGARAAAVANHHLIERV